MPPAVSNRTKLPRRAAKPSLPRLSRQHKPEGMTLEDWQTQLRRQFGREQTFEFKNVGQDAIFSEYLVSNPQSGTTYRVVIRGESPAENTCSCPDFATNALGTCKHVEFMLAKLANKRGGRAALRAGFRPAYSEVVVKYGSRRRVRMLPGADCPASLRELAIRYFEKDGFLRPEAFGTFEKFLADAAQVGHEVRCGQDALGLVAEVRDAEQRARRIDEAFPKGKNSAAFKKLLKIEMYDYQREGALFAARAGRSLIGDEMGLGKTVQAIAAAEIMARHLGVTRVLIVCPTSLKHQWEREIGRFIGRSVKVIGGGLTRRREAYKSDSFYKITNYDTVHRDLEAIGAWSPDLVILDEAQRIKNWATRTARNVKRIASPHAIVLTGTPLENRLEELVSIVQFVDQHRLGPTYRFLADHQLHDETGRVVGYKGLDTIGKTLAPILIRRRKKDVLTQLPGRLDKNFFVPMTPEQMAHHDENRDMVAKVVHKWRKYKFLSEADKRRLMIALQNMRMSCDSSYLLDQNSEHGVKADEFMTLLQDLYEEPENKVVVFSQWVRMHELLIRRMEARGLDHVLFHGGVPGTRRGQLIDRFREDDRCRAFFSTDAGGVGLNLQHASVVINMDLPWNPAVLEQRIGRVHRLGQKRPVQVINFVSQGTIEEGMLSVLKFKKSLFSGALDGGESEVFMGGSRLTKFMETVEKTTGSIPEQQATDPPEAAAETAADERDSIEARAGEAGGESGGALGPAGHDARQASDAAQGWTKLLELGTSFLEEISRASRSDANTSQGRAAPGAAAFVRTDPKSGERYVHLPMPRQEVLDRLLGAAAELLGRLRG